MIGGRAAPVAAPEPDTDTALVDAAAGGDGLGRLLRHTHGTFSGMGLQPAVHWLLHGGGEQPRDYEGTTVPSVEGVRNSWEIWKQKMPEDELAHAVADFAAKREDTLVQEERWRNKMMRRLGDKFDHVDGRLDRVSDRLDQVVSALQAMGAGGAVAFQPVATSPRK